MSVAVVKLNSVFAFLLPWFTVGSRQIFGNVRTAICSRTKLYFEHNLGFQWARSRHKQLHQEYINKLPNFMFRLQERALEAVHQEEVVLSSSLHTHTHTHTSIVTFGWLLYNSLCLLYFCFLNNSRISFAVNFFVETFSTREQTVPHDYVLTMYCKTHFETNILDIISTDDYESI